MHGLAVEGRCALLHDTEVKWRDVLRDELIDETRAAVGVLSECLLLDLLAETDLHVVRVENGRLSSMLFDCVDARLQVSVVLDALLAFERWVDTVAGDVLGLRRPLGCSHRHNGSLLDTALEADRSPDRFGERQRQISIDVDWLRHNLARSRNYCQIDDFCLLDRLRPDGDL